MLLKEFALNMRKLKPKDFLIVEEAFKSGSWKESQDLLEQRKDPFYKLVKEMPTRKHPLN